MSDTTRPQTWEIVNERELDVLETGSRESLDNLFDILNTKINFPFRITLSGMDLTIHESEYQTFKTNGSEWGEVENSFKMATAPIQGVYKKYENSVISLETGVTSSGGSFSLGIAESCPSLGIGQYIILGFQATAIGTIQASWGNPNVDINLASYPILSKGTAICFIKLKASADSIGWGTFEAVKPEDIIIFKGSGGGGGGGLDVWQQTVIGVINDPPLLPSEGDRYLIDTAPTNIWVTYKDYIAVYESGQWQYTAPEIGMHLPVSTNDGGVYVYGGASWQYKKWELTTASGFINKDVNGDITLKNLNNKNIIVGNGSNTAVSYDTSLVSSDIEFSSSSVTIKNGVVEDGMIVQDYIQTSEIDTTTLDWNGTELSVKSTGINHDATSGFVSDKHVAHSSITISSELNGGLSGSGTLAGNIYFKVNVENTVEKTAIDNDDLVLIHDSLTDSLKRVKKQLISSKTNYTAIVAPIVSDDASQGYSEGSVWIDTLTDKVYTCVDSTIGASLWKSDEDASKIFSYVQENMGKESFPYSYAAWLDVAIDKATKTDISSTAIYDYYSKAYFFPLGTELLITDSLLGDDFLAQNIDLDLVNCEIYTSNGLVPVLDLSRDGVNYQTATLSRVGLTNKYFAEYLFTDEPSDSLIQNIVSAGGDISGTVLTKNLVLTDASYIKTMDLVLTKTLAPTGYVLVTIVDSLSNLVFSKYLDASLLITGTNTLDIKVALKADTYTVNLIGDATYVSGYPTNKLALDSDGITTKGRKLDLRMKVGGAAGLLVDGIAVYFGSAEFQAIEKANPVQEFSFAGEENRTQFEITTFSINKNIKCYDSTRGVVYTWDSFLAVNGQTIIFQDGIFQRPVETVKLRFEQHGGFDNSDNNSAAIAAQSVQIDNLISNGGRNKTALISYDTASTRLALTTSAQDIPFNRIHGLDPDIVTSLAAGQFILPAGTYDSSWFAVHFVNASSTAIMRTYLYNVSDLLEIESGSLAEATNPVSTSSSNISQGNACFTITSEKIFAIKAINRAGATGYNSVGDNFVAPFNMKAQIKITKLNGL